MTGKTLRLILGDQLSRNISSLADAESASDIVVMAELHDETTYVKHHKKKIAFLFSAMRHFAEELRGNGLAIDYLEYSKDGPPSFTTFIKDAIARHEAERLVVTEPGEWRLLEMMKGWREEFECDVEIRPDTRFLCSHDGFEKWAGDDPRSLRMENFYRHMRKMTGFLMEGDEPAGGKWNYDKQNRETLPERVAVPERPDYSIDDLTQAVLQLVGNEFEDHFGDLEPFNFPVTRRQALHYLNWFIETALPDFGDYQDAMKQGEPLLFHSHLSALINCGLLDPRECCEKAEEAWREGNAPINAVEGFIRQIIGWREFIRGIYWLKMPDYASSNALRAQRKLPEFFWTAETGMNCLAQSISETKANAYAHHIQRLMVIGNFCLIAGINPREVQEWYLLVYHDAYEWVEMPNVVGMILYADDGFFASKPYAASGAYINRMSDYCKNCRYKVSRKLGKDACPFNYLYWDFIGRHRDRFARNHRMGLIVSQYDKKSDGEKNDIREDARSFLDGLG